MLVLAGNRRHSQHGCVMPDVQQCTSQPVVMMLTGIDDIRMLYENDVRIIGQFAP